MHTHGMCLFLNNRHICKNSAHTTLSFIEAEQELVKFRQGKTMSNARLDGLNVLPSSKEKVPKRRATLLEIMVSKEYY